MASSQIPLPEKIDSKKPEEWKRWIERFECYHAADGLDEKDDKVQVNTLVYAMGWILEVFVWLKGIQYTRQWSAASKHTLWAAQMFIERARFNRPVQGEKESVVEFIESIYELAETCQFGPITEELIRDR